MIAEKKYVYAFSEGNKDQKELLGGKGANLADMANLGLPVPSGFIISTEACGDYYAAGKKIKPAIIKQVEKKLAGLEKAMGKKLGDKKNPLLVSVRSGAALSMPGMMDTILNLGLNDETVLALAANTKNERFAYDSYRRFIQMFGDVVMAVKHEHFEAILQAAKNAKGVKFDTELDAGDLKKIIADYKKLIQREAGRLFPDDTQEQLLMAIDAVFNSWNNSRAIAYRRLYNIHGLLGTAVTVQSMVFGNMGDDSGTGVCFTRNPATGENLFYGEFLVNAQGEDVVAGIRTPQNMDELKKIMPQIYQQLLAIRSKLEKHYRDMQDMEFTIERGKLFMLQTRNGKRTAAAAVRIAVELVAEGLLSQEEALLKVDPESLNQFLHKRLNPEEKNRHKLLTKGLPASPGAAVGQAVFTADHAKEMALEGEKVILVRLETSPEDIEGMHAAQGILTARGGMTSHAAVVGRGMGKCCVVGCAELNISEKEKVIECHGQIIRENDWLTLDGSTGEVFLGAVEMIEPQVSGHFAKIMAWADAARTLAVRANADTPQDAAMALKFGAQGIGLCRTEHMFFEESRIKAVREMILAETVEGRKAALEKILPMQRNDFKALFEVMAGLPLTIRFLDPPLHEFLPKEDEEITDLAKDLGVSFESLKNKVIELHELNPMLGHRGCRLGITYPEISEMQSRAVFEATAELIKAGKIIVPEIMIPLVGKVEEFTNQKAIVDAVAALVKKEQGVEFRYQVGTMIEVPRAAITADQIAGQAEFFSYGTNDLTQMTCGFSRDDAGKFLESYVQTGIYKRDPFQSIDLEGVGALMKLSIAKARPVRPDIKLGICGEHGGDPASVEFCHQLGLDYVSCSPFRLPIARLAAAQAKIRETLNKI